MHGTLCVNVANNRFLPSAATLRLRSALPLVGRAFSFAKSSQAAGLRFAIDVVRLDGAQTPNGQGANEHPGQIY